MPEKTQPDEQPIELPVMYFNGFQIGMTNSDVSGILLLNGQPQTIANFSYTTAKTLHEALGKVISGLESATDQKIMTTREIEAGMNAAQNGERVDR